MFAYVLHLCLIALLLLVFARHEAEVEWWRILLIFVPVLIVVQVASVAIGEWGLVVYLVAIILSLQQWFYLNWQKAALIALAHIGVTTGAEIAVVNLFQADGKDIMTPSIQTPGDYQQTPIEPLPTSDPTW